MGLIMALTTTLPWKFKKLDHTLIDTALAEDLGLPYKDVTTLTLFPDINKIASAKIISKQPEPSIICGLPIVKAILAKLSEGCEVYSDYLDGDCIHSAAVVLTVTGPAQALFAAERTVLNFLQHLSAIATLTNQFVSKVSHTKTKILDTRKTLPGLRNLEKYAVQCGGGVNHRMGLYDGIMVKDTHIDLLGGIKKALNALPENIASKCPVILEVRSQEELTLVLENGLQKITRVLLDNMSLPLMRECVALCQDIIPTEASGNINLDNVVAVAETGVNFISIGKLTHSAGNIDLSMKCDI